MKLIPRRKKSPTALERAAGYAGLGAKGLAAQRVVRRGVKGYRFTKRLAQLAGLAALGAWIAKKRGGGDSTPSYAPPPASTGSSAGTASPAATAATGTPPGGGGDAPTEVPPADASGTEEELEIEGPNQSTPPPPESTKT